MPFRLDPNQSPTPKTGFRPEKKTIEGFIGNVGKSGVNLAKNMGESLINVVNPDLEKNTIANLAGTAIDTGKYIVGDRSDTNKFRQLADFYKTRYGGLENIGNTLYNDPVGAAMDVSMVAGGAGALAKAGGLGRTASALNKVSEFTNPVNAVTKPLGMLKKSISVNKIGNAIEGQGNKIVTAGLGNPVTQIDDAGRVINEYGLHDRLPETAQAARAKNISMYDEIGLRGGKQIQLNKILKSIDNAIEELSTGKNQYSKSAQAQVEEMLRRRAEIVDMAGGTTPAGTGVMVKNPNKINTNISDVIEYRRALDKDIPKSQFNLDAKGSGSAQGMKEIRNILREKINASDPRLEKLGMDYGKLKNLEEVFTQYQKRASNRQLFGLKQVALGGLGNAVKGFPGMVGAIAMDQLMNSPDFIKGLSKSLQNTGRAVKGLDKVKLPNMPGKNIFRTATKVGKFGYLANPKRNQ